MFTSRAEHRLHLRSDNADQRLTAKGRSLELVDDDRWRRYEARQAAIDSATELLRSHRVEGAAAIDYLRRPTTDWDMIVRKLPAASAVDPAVGQLVEVRVKYAPYIERQDEQIRKFAKLEEKLIPGWVDYARVTGLRNEAKTKLAQFSPRSLGQALRISGITPADVTLLAIHLDRGSRPSATGPAAT
jgi:tRNA uridine 5-carboxymethylaminomethyl modification enzyme